MEIWLDTSNLSVIARANGLGILHGVTTNPTILSLSETSPQEFIKRVLEEQRGLLAIQVLASDAEGMCKQAKILSSISERILIKIPVTQNGIKAIYELTQEGVPTLATAIFELRQALLAFKAGAHYLAPYIKRIDDTGVNSMEVLSQMQSMKQQYGFKGKIMGAGLKDLSVITACIEMGLSALTLNESIFEAFIQEYEPTLSALEKFSEDWSKSIFSRADFYSLDMSSPREYSCKNC